MGTSYKLFKADDLLIVICTNRKGGSAAIILSERGRATIIFNRKESSTIVLNTSATVSKSKTKLNRLRLNWRTNCALTCSTYIIFK